MNYSFIRIYFKCLCEKVRVCDNLIAFNLLVHILTIAAQCGSHSI